ncbi:M23 family metallopeptidase [Patescibacteria group bacterium]
MIKQSIVAIIVLAVIVGVTVPVLQVNSVQAAEIREIIFPVFGAVRRSGDFGAPRVGHTHEGNDIFAEKGRPLLAAVDGTVRWLAFPEASWGWGLEVENEDGYRYRYLHLNNDTPGTDDGMGGGRNAYAPGVDDGVEVLAGQLIGFIGDSGNAETTPPHLHFEIRRPDDTPIDPFESLNQARRVAVPVQREPWPGEFFAYGPYQGGANVAVGDVSFDYDGEEIITGAMAGGGPHVRVFNNKGRVISQFYAFAPSFRGGVEVATGDVTGNGRDEIITAAATNGGPHIRIFSKSGRLISQFFAYKKDTRHGVRIAAADLDDSGIDEIITAPATGGPPIVRVFKPNGYMIREFRAYRADFRGGVDVTAVEATDESKSYIITGAGPGGKPKVRVFSHKGIMRWQFLPYDQDYRGGIKVSAAECMAENPSQEIFVAPATNGGPDFKVVSKRGKLVDNPSAFEQWWKGDYDIAVGTEKAYVATGPGGRRVSVQQLK